MSRFIYGLIAIACIGMSACIALAEEKAVKGSTIRGEVIEVAGENNPIEGVTVKIVGSDGKEWTAKTDAKGKYEFTGLPAGRYTFNVSKIGYHSMVGKQKVVAADSEVIERIKMRKNDFEKFFAEGLLQHVSESIGKRYKLDAPTVEALRKSILEAFNTVVEQENQDLRHFAQIEEYSSIALLIAMLSHSDCKAAFAKYLTETQLQDYLDFTKARQQLVQQAIAQFITAYLDQALCLTVKQRENIVKLLLDAINDKQGLTLTSIMNESLGKGTVNLIHNELNISLDDILSQPQSKIWQGLVNRQDDHKDLVAVEVVGVPSDNEAEKDETDEKTPKSQKWILAEATLNAHTKNLGPLNESASKRLETATNGVVQQYVERQKPDVDEKSKFDAALGPLMQAFMQQTISQKQAIEKLESIKKELWGEKHTKKQWDEYELYEITKHPLYQQAIKEVLSEDAYSQYKARQAERENFRIQAPQNLVVAWIDTVVLLNDTQRKQLKIKISTTQLTSPSISDGGLQLMLVEFLIRMDNEILSPWQQGVFKGVK